MIIAATASQKTLQAREVERQIYKIYVTVEERDGQNSVSDLWAALRLAWMEAGRDLEACCAVDGISRWNYRWPA